jgi:hypothetical protein
MGKFGISLLGSGRSHQAAVGRQRKIAAPDQAHLLCVIRRSSILAFENKGPVKAPQLVWRDRIFLFDRLLVLSGTKITTLSRSLTIT